MMHRENHHRNIPQAKSSRGQAASSPLCSESAGQGQTLLAPGRKGSLRLLVCLLAVLLLGSLLSGCSLISSPDGPTQAVSQTAEAVQGPTCSIVIDCSVLLDHLEELEKGKRSLVPEDGILLQLENVAFTQGETVFEVVSRELRARNLHFEYTGTPEAAYFQGIGNLYEFDCGPLSGWEYRINGEYPGVGCGQCAVSEGDAIQWYYTCDLGRDIGNDSLE